MRNKGRFSTSFLVGLLALPLAAAGATALVASRSPSIDELALAAETPSLAAKAAPTTAAPSQVTTPPIAEATATAAAGNTESASTQDIQRACGEAGLDLVQRELDGALSDLEQAALDALRSVCETEGTPLQGPPAPAPVVRTVTVAQTAPSTASLASATSTDDRDDDHDDDDHDDDDDGDDERDDRDDD